MTQNPPPRKAGLTLLPLAKLRTDGGTQSRCKLDEQTAEEYAEVYRADGGSMPPVVAFHDGRHYWLADGFTRHRGHQLAGRKYIEVDVRPGSRRDAVLFGLSANTRHGQRPTPADRRRAATLMLSDPEWSGWSNREIARRCGCDGTTVGTIRSELEEMRSRVDAADAVADVRPSDVPADLPERKEPGGAPSASRRFAADEGDDQGDYLVEVARQGLGQAREALVELGGEARRAVVAVDLALNELGNVGG